MWRATANQTAKTHDCIELTAGGGPLRGTRDLERAWYLDDRYITARDADFCKRRECARLQSFGDEVVVPGNNDRHADSWHGGAPFNRPHRNILRSTHSISSRWPALRRSGCQKSTS